jgi:hypothetical protein
LQNGENFARKENAGKAPPFVHIVPPYGHKVLPYGCISIASKSGMLSVWWVAYYFGGSPIIVVGVYQHPLLQETKHFH